MKSILQLNLHDTNEQAEKANLPKPADAGPPSAEERKKLELLANRVAHKAAAEYGRRGSGIFSK